MADPNARAPSATRWRVNIIAATWLSYAGFYFCRKTFGIAKPLLKEEYGWIDTELAWVWTAYLAAYMIGQFSAAFFGRKLACRTLLLIGMMVSVLCNIAIGYATLGGQSAFWWLITFMVINGFAQATGWPGNVGLLAKWSQRSERGRLMGIWGTCYQIGSILAKHFAAFMLGWLGIAWSFWGASIVLFAVWVLFYFLVKERPEDVGLPDFVEEVKVDDAESSVRPVLPWRRVVHVVIAMGMIYFCFKFIRYALDSWTATLIKDSFEITAENAGHLSTVFDWVGFLGVVVGGFASDKLFKSRRTPVIFIMTVGLCLATGALMLNGTSSLVLFVIATGVIGFMLMGPDSLLSGTAAMDVSTKEMAVVAAGIINGLGSIGALAQEPTIAWLKTHHGVDSVLQLLFAVTCLGVVGTGLLWWGTKKMGFKL
jgi:sugar phosphate permease